MNGVRMNQAYLDHAKRIANRCHSVRVDKQSRKLNLDGVLEDAERLIRTLVAYIEDAPVKWSKPK